MWNKNVGNILYTVPLQKHDVYIIAVEEGSVGRKSGLKYGDSILMCANSSKKTNTLVIHSLQTPHEGELIKKINVYFDRTLKDKQTIILFVSRHRTF